MKAPVNRISRRGFFKFGLEFAALAGLGELRPKRAPAPARANDKALAGSPTVGLSRAGSDNFFGTQTHFGQYRTGAEDVLDLIKGGGVGWIRDEIYWSEIEKTKGLFIFPPAYDHYLRAAQARGIQVLLILDFGNSLYSSSEKAGPSAETERQAFARYCREVIKRCRPFGVRHYEIWNEPNASMFWRPSPHAEDYAKLLETAARACKEADPGATVLGCSTAGTDLDFIGRVMRAGGGRYMDGVSFHPYCQPLPPERRLSTDISKLEKLAPGKPLWITEFGYPTSSGDAGVDEDMQANYLVRAFLLAKTSPAVKRMFWYDFQNDGEDLDEAEFNFGLVRMNKSPKPAYKAARTMASLVGDLPPAEYEINGNTHIVRFGEKKTSLLAVWRLGGAESLEIPWSKGACRIIERDGESRTIEVKGPLLEIEVSEKPRYIVPAV